eukprot:108883-Rhodomonas_salina.1
MAVTQVTAGYQVLNHCCAVSVTVPTGPGPGPGYPGYCSWNLYGFGNVFPEGMELHQRSLLEGCNPKEEVLLLDGKALEQFTMHPVYGSMTSHEILACMANVYKRQGGRENGDRIWNRDGGLSQMKALATLTQAGRRGPGYRNLSK